MSVFIFINSSSDNTYVADGFVVHNCQSFSIAGKRMGFEDTRGTLFYEYVRLVKEIQPKVFIYENVYGVLTHDKGKTWETMQNVFSDLGYYFSWQILDARDYGLFCDDKDEDGETILGIRYNEALALECAYQRRALQQLTMRMGALERG